MPGFELRLLGGATLLDADGSPVGGSVAHRHRLALLACLALAPSGGITREKLVGLLWPERDETSARHLLRTSLHVLRQTLGPSVVRSQGANLCLDQRWVHVDVHAFEAAIARDDATSAVALYRGPFLDGLFLDDAEEFETWVSAERERLARAARRAMAAAPAVAPMADGSLRRATSSAEPLVAVAESDPADAVPTDPPREAGPSTSSFRRPFPRIRGSRRTGLVAAAIGVVAVAALAWAGHTATTRGAAPADLLAVAPFDLAGNVPAELRDGLPTLLAASLDQAGGVHVLPARVVAARLQAAEAAHGALDDAGRARAAGGLLVTGVVAAAPEGVVVRAALVDTTGPITRFAARGAAGDLPGLVDQLAGALLRAMWGNAAHVSAVRLAAVTTTSVDALRDYVRGEQHLRAGRWDSAAVAFAQAVERDSTFALAQLRRAEAVSWWAASRSAP